MDNFRECVLISLLLVHLTSITKSLEKLEHQNLSNIAQTFKSNIDLHKNLSKYWYKYIETSIAEDLLGYRKYYFLVTFLQHIMPRKLFTKDNEINNAVACPSQHVPLAEWHITSISTSSLVVQEFLPEGLRKIHE